VENDPNSPYAGEFYSGPMVVLTSRFSASASEILAGALQDYDRAVVVGDSATHGKGTVQSLVSLLPYFKAAGLNPTNNPGAVKVTIRKFYRASGKSTQLMGVTPDIVLPSIYNDAKIGEDALENPLPGDAIEAASYQKMNRVTPYLDALTKRSQARVNADKDFAYLREEIVLAKKARDEKSVLLNEAQRLKEKQEADDRVKARKKELASRPEPPGKVYEITLKNVDLPGLQPPPTKTNALKSASREPPQKTRFKVAQADARVSRQPGGQGAAQRSEGVAASSTAKGEGAAPAEAQDEESSGESSAEDNVPALDITLDEAKRILIDLFSLSAKGATVAGTSQEPQPRTPGVPPQKVER